MFKSVFFSSLCILASIILGGVLGSATDLGSTIGGYTDPILIALVVLLFIDAPIHKFGEAFKSPKILGVLWLSNFLIIPFLGFAITKLCFPNQPLIALGVAIYFMSPCTDWFLGFTRLAKGNTALGSLLLPINMLTQLLLYPVYLSLFSLGTDAHISASEIGDSLLNWFLLPVVYAVIVRVVIHFLPENIKEKLGEFISHLINIAIYLLIFSIFADRIGNITENYKAFAMVLLAVFIFFVVTTLMVDFIAKKLSFSHENHVLYSMTTTARNAPMMLGITMSVLPSQDMIYVAIILGMLVEFPFLAFQAYRLNKLSEKVSSPSSESNQRQEKLA